MNEPKKDIRNVNRRFYSLDGIRGIAAILVVLYHFTSHAGGIELFQGAYVAVDLFFILSGFVLIHSYGEKISNGMSLKKFFIIRFVRLYPMFLLGLLIGLTALILNAYIMGDLNKDGDKIINATILNFFLLPYLNFDNWAFDQDILLGIIFPLNDPGWSLFFEVFVNALFFLYVSKFRNIKLLNVVILSYAFFIFYILYFRSANPGWGTHNFLGGFPRVVSEFFIGVLIYQNYEKYKVKSRFISLITVLILSFVFLSIISLGNVKLNIINTVILAPIIVFIFSSLEFNSLGNKFCAYIGDLSYPLYILHVPVYHLVLNLQVVKSIEPNLRVGLILLITVGLSILMIKCDSKVRIILSNIFGIRKNM